METNMAEQDEPDDFPKFSLPLFTVPKRGRPSLYGTNSAKKCVADNRSKNRRRVDIGGAFDQCIFEKQRADIVSNEDYAKLLLDTDR